MQDKKNRLMLWLSAAAVLLNVIIFIVTRTFDPFRHTMGIHGSGFEMNILMLWAQNGLFLLPIVSLGLAVYWFLNKEHVYLPWLNTLTLTFSSFSIISGSGGNVEFHFSIFMVIAAAAYYENTRLIAMMTVLFAIQHVMGFFFFPQLIFGTDTYPFLMVGIHAVFLVITSIATIWQIRSKRSITSQLEDENRSKEDKIMALLEHVQSLSGQIGSTTGIVSETSEQNVRTNQEMRYASEEVTGGLGDQALSLEQMESKLRNINLAIQSALFVSSEEMKKNAIVSEQAIMESHGKTRVLKEYMMQISESAIKPIDFIAAATFFC
ncbi:hypothetical protein GC093_08410 [Paenibacillus sp. LMG 31456]|uniref:Methyl-accepting chemotaxis protein n=1 Tax=Paenibacillus foliorum TaxID=2654974 RepID=A0A972GUV1_9BACL|nr:methyl-accepting chemotaxis protein [Paenibacillus foliorum]NOU93240.1 hypothetical protein [Paenibacillus foliorum]